MLRPKLPPYQRSKSINQPSKKQIMLTNTILKDLPNGTEPLEHQVAGHTFQVGTDEMGNVLFILIILHTIFFILEVSIDCRHAEESIWRFGYESSRKTNVRFTWNQVLWTITVGHRWSQYWRVEEIGARISRNSQHAFQGENGMIISIHKLTIYIWSFWTLNYGVSSRSRLELVLL